MRKVRLVAALALSCGGFVSAQGNLAINFFGGTILTVQNCARASAQRVVCTGSIVNNREDDNFYFNSGSFTLISPAGDEARLSGATVRGANAYNQGSLLRKSISYPVQLTFDGYGASTIKYFDAPSAQLESRRFENVPLLTSAARPTATPAGSAPSGAVSTLGPGQVVLGGRAYTVTLTGCRTNAAGTYTCTGAAATPLR